MRQKRIKQKLFFLVWVGACIAASLMIDGNQALKGFQEQPLTVKVGAWLGLLAFAIAAIFSGYLLALSWRTRSVREAMHLLPSAATGKQPSLWVFQACCVACIASFLGFCTLLLTIMLA
jgi:hypothetical protein